MHRAPKFGETRSKLQARTYLTGQVRKKREAQFDNGIVDMVAEQPSA